MNQASLGQLGHASSTYFLYIYTIHTKSMCFIIIPKDLYNHFTCVIEPVVFFFSNHLLSLFFFFSFLKCWGMNQAGQLGQEDFEQRGGPNGGVFEMGDNLPPVDIVGASGSADGLEVESIALGGSSACAVISGGLLKVRVSVCMFFFFFFFPVVVLFATCPLLHCS